ncbi:MAG TPA: UbiA family prenyltransferase [Cyclobacteriaceae bacterium]|nr:UbiA family prenyltransferase [Cyclobacteriaceae bacterium]
MLSRSTWLHLRITFSYFLLPVFLFSLAISPNLDVARLFWVFFILHFLLYPASNGYNSYFDKDEKSIGGLKNPPPVSKQLYFVAISLDAIAIIVGYLTINTTFAAMLLLYGLVSKAYSHPSIRLKKYPIIGWLTAGLFQGYFTLLMSYVGINDFSLESSLNERVSFAGLLASFMLLGNYPMTQVYQHGEDSRRGDYTFSIMLGIRGTFFFVAAVFSIVSCGFCLYFMKYFSLHHAVIFLVSLFPVLVYFFFWLSKILRDISIADFSHTMLLNFISATCLNAFFIYLFLSSTHILNVF